MSEEFARVPRRLLELCFRSLNGGDNQLSGMEHGAAFREVRALLAAPPQPDHSAQMYTCTGKGGSYARIGTALGAGTHRGDIIEVYRSQNGQLYFRETAEFFERMERIEPQPLDTVQGDAQAAISTLRSLEYTYHEGQLWKPPLGKKPNFGLIDDLKQQLATAEQLLRRYNTRSDLEAYRAKDIEEFLAASAKPEGGEV